MFALWAPEAPKTDPVALYVQRDAHADRSHGYSSQGEARPLWVAVCARSARPYKRPTPYASETFRMDTHTRPELRICDIRRLSKERWHAALAALAALPSRGGWRGPFVRGRAPSGKSA